jgi:microcystin-dependent protein
MATPYLSQISLLAFGFAPKGWALCNGQVLPINQNQALFALLGVQYGGNGQTTFALPDLRGRTPMHLGNAGPQGLALGAEAVALNAGQLPRHGHALLASSDLANSNLPANALPAARPRGGVAMYGAPGGTGIVQMHPTSLTGSGGNQPHDNMQPYLTVNFAIALQGIFPSRN